MAIVTDRSNNNQSLEDELEALRLDLATAREWLRHEEEQRERMIQEEQYQRRVFALDNQIVSGAQKIVFLALRSFVLSKRDISKALGEWVEVPMWEIAKLTGLSNDTVGSSIKRLYTVGLLERDERKETLKDGTKRTHIFVALTLLSYSLEIIPDVPLREHGGDPRKRCKHCQSDKLVRRTVVVCKSCGMNQDEPVETPVNPPDKIDEYVELQEREREQEDIRQARQAVEEEEKRQQEQILPKPPEPVGTCSLCERDYKKRVRSWVWRSEEKEYCCQSCFSTFSASERERARLEKERGPEWTPF